MALINEAGWDRAIRVVLGLLLLYLGWGGVVEGTAGTVLKIVGFLPLATGLIGWCPAYTVCNMRTNKG